MLTEDKMKHDIEEIPSPIWLGIRMNFSELKKLIPKSILELIF